MNHACLNLTKGRPMKQWAFVSAALCRLVLVALTAPLPALACAPQVAALDAAKAYRHRSHWLSLTACVGFHIGALVTRAVANARETT